MKSVGYATIPLHDGWNYGWRMKGMTAFGRACVSNGRYEVVAEISSVNKKHLDISFRLPREFAEIEGELKRQLSSSIFRGQVQLSVRARPTDPSLSVPSVDWAAVDGQIALIQTLAERVDCPVPMEDVCLEIWKRYYDRGESPLEGTLPEVGPLISQAVCEACAAFDERRRYEGQFLAEDLRTRADAVRDCTREIAEAIVGYVDTVRQKLVARVAEQIPDLAVDDRLLREVVLYADRADVSEELGRIHHHLDHLGAVFQEQAAIGKHMEFIIQELLREYNTLGAKVSLSSVSTMVITAKTELEKMREQVQNVE